MKKTLIPNSMQEKETFNFQKQPTETKELEKEIDQMVYKLYDLTEKEIKIVEESTI